MRLRFKSKNIEITEALKDYATKRLEKLDKYFDTENLTATVTMIVEKEMQKVEVIIPLNNFALRGEEASRDMYTSIDKVVEKLGRQIRKYKTRMNRQFENVKITDYLPARQEPELLTGDETLEEEARIVKRKNFTIKPMFPEEAILQMDMLGHNFFVFLNPDTDEMNIVYKRKDGNYGMIEPSAK